MPRGLRRPSKIVNDALATQDRRRPKHCGAFDADGSTAPLMLRWRSYSDAFILFAHLCETARQRPFPRAIQASGSAGGHDVMAGLRG